MASEGKSLKSTQCILVVDDNIMSRKVIELRLDKDGYTTMMAESGAEALEIVKNNSVDLIFLDLVMEGLSGMDVLASLKADERFNQIPVVVISGIEDADTIEDCLAAGANDFLHKPVKPETLKHIVNDLLGRSIANDDGGTPQASIDLNGLTVFDASYIAQLSNDYGAETALSFVDRFMDLAPEQNNNIARNKSDFETCRKATNGLKGGARTLGLSRLAATCREIEIACADKDEAALSSSIEVLQINLEQALQALRDNAVSV